MDVKLLEEMGLHPEVIGPAQLADYRIRIGDRATLVPKGGSVAYGMVMDLADLEATNLYSKAGVSDYQPVNIDVTMIGDSAVLNVTSYILPPGEMKNIANAEYAEKLAKLVLELGFSPTYASEISVAQEPNK